MSKQDELRAAQGQRFRNGQLVAEVEEPEDNAPTATPEEARWLIRQAYNLAGIHEYI